MKRILLFVLIFPIGMIYGGLQKQKLTDYSKNTYSQFGEDGIIEQIFAIIGTQSKTVIEFGAADGFSCSNTANLWSKDLSWFGVLIEADDELYKKVVTNVAPYNCRAIRRAGRFQILIV